MPLDTKDYDALRINYPYAQLVSLLSNLARQRGRSAQVMQSISDLMLTEEGVEGYVHYTPQSFLLENGELVTQESQAAFSMLSLRLGDVINTRPERIASADYYGKLIIKVSKFVPPTGDHFVNPFAKDAAEWDTMVYLDDANGVWVSVHCSTKLVDKNHHSDDASEDIYEAVTEIPEEPEQPSDEESEESFLTPPEAILVELYEDDYDDEEDYDTEDGSEDD